MENIIDDLLKYEQIYKINFSVNDKNHIYNNLINEYKFCIFCNFIKTIEVNNIEYVKYSQFVLDEELYNYYNLDNLQKNSFWHILILYNVENSQQYFKNIKNLQFYSSNVYNLNILEICIINKKFDIVENFIVNNEKSIQLLFRGKIDSILNLSIDSDYPFLLEFIFKNTLTKNDLLYSELVCTISKKFLHLIYLKKSYKMLYTLLIIYKKVIGPYSNDHFYDKGHFYFLVDIFNDYIDNENSILHLLCSVKKSDFDQQNLNNWNYFTKIFMELIELCNTRLKTKSAHFLPMHILMFNDNKELMYFFFKNTKPILTKTDIYNNLCISYGSQSTLEFFKIMVGNGVFNNLEKYNKILKKLDDTQDKKIIEKRLLQFRYKKNK